MIQVVFDKRALVDSTVIKEIATEGEDLYVKFSTTGGWYRLDGAGSLYDDLLYADSPNGWYAKHLKGKWPTFKLYVTENVDGLTVVNLQKC